MSKFFDFFFWKVPTHCVFGMIPFGKKCLAGFSGALSNSNLQFNCPMLLLRFYVGMCIDSGFTI